MRDGIGVYFRPMAADADAARDRDVIRRAHAAHRAALFAPMGWPADALARLCDQQHDLQERHIAAYNRHAEHRMIVIDGEPVGRLCVDTARLPWRIVDIALLPEAQGLGLGGAALRMLIAEATAAGVAIDLTVGRDNPRAEALYRRLGFVAMPEESASHVRMVLPL